MERSSPEPSPRREVLVDGGIAGCALGIMLLAGGWMVLDGAGPTLPAAATTAFTFGASLLVGIWAGWPASHAGDDPAADAADDVDDRDAGALRDRWLIAAAGAALAGMLAVPWAAAPALAPTAFGRMLALLVMVATPAYAAGLLLPVLLARGERRWREEEISGSDPAAASTLTIAVIGGMTIGSAIAGLLLAPIIGPAPTIFAAAMLFATPLIRRTGNGLQPRERLLHRTHTLTGEVRVTEVIYPGERQPERRLYLNGEQESGELARSGAPTLAYVAAAENWLASATPAGADYLFLGGGAYTLPRRIAERDPHARITAVEIDPEITRLAHRFFGARAEHRIRVVHGDARAYLDRGDPGRFDRIYMDVYGGDEAIPYSLVTREGFAALAARMAPGAEAGINLIGVTAGPESVRPWAVVRTALEVFPAAALYSHLGADYPDPQNLLLLLATDGDRAFPESAGVLDRWDRERWEPLLSNATVLLDIFPSAT